MRMVEKKITPRQACIIHHLNKRMPLAGEIESYEFPELEVIEDSSPYQLHAVIITWRTDQFHVSYNDKKFSVDEVTNRQDVNFGLASSNKARLLEALLNVTV